MATKKADFAAWKKQATPDEVSVGVVLDRRLYREFQDTVRLLEESRTEGMLEQPPEIRDLAEKLVDLKARIDRDRDDHTFVFQTISYDDWRAVAEAHPPTDAQKAEHKYIEYNPDTWPQAAVALACVSPELTVDDADWLRQNLPRQEWQRLVDGAIQANVGGSELPKSASGTVRQLASVLKSTTPPSEGSPSPSSEDGS